MTDWIDTALRYVQAAGAAIDSVGMTIAIAILASILAAVGGISGMRYRLYGAVVGGMIANVVVKAMGGGFMPALAAMLGITLVGAVLGSTPLLVVLIKRMGRARRGG